MYNDFINYRNGVNKMSKSQLNQAIEKVAKATDKSKQQIADNLAEKDSWTWFLIRQAA